MSSPASSVALPVLATQLATAAPTPARLVVLGRRRDRQVAERCGSNPAPGTGEIAQRRALGHMPRGSWCESRSPRQLDLRSLYHARLAQRRAAEGQSLRSDAGSSPAARSQHPRAHGQTATTLGFKPHEISVRSRVCPSQAAGFHSGKTIPGCGRLDYCREAHCTWGRSSDGKRARGFKTPVSVGSSPTAPFARTDQTREAAMAVHLRAS